MSLEKLQHEQIYMKLIGLFKKHPFRRQGMLGLQIKTSEIVALSVPWEDLSRFLKILCIQSYSGFWMFTQFLQFCFHRPFLFLDGY